MILNSEVTRLAPTQRQLGAFYTPENICKRLCEWAIRTSEDTILEPSFGQCGFITAAIERLSDLGNIEPAKNLFGSDIDSKAFDYLKKELGIWKQDHKFIKKDFLSIRSFDFLNHSFTAAIGNPPYLPLSGMSHHQVEKGQEIVKVLKQPLQKRAGLWAYFVIHSLSFLEESGRAAWVLPRSMLFSVYGKQVQSIIASYFRNIYIIDYMDRLFTEYGTEERTVILLCEYFSQKKTEGNIKVIYTDSIVKELNNKTLIDWLEGKEKNKNSDILEIFRLIAARDFVKSLEEIGSIKIGIVTGANKYFIINKQQAKAQNLTKHFLKPIFSKSKFVKGIKLSLPSYVSEEKTNANIYLIDTVALENKAPNLFDIFSSSIPDELKLSNKTFQKNKPWHNPDDHKIPDAFLVYMNQYGPRIILNEGKLNCTNSIHRFYFNNPIDIFQQELVCISILTSFSQLSAEIEGRNYGTGVLKIEPSEGKKIKVLIPENLSNTAIETTFETINNLLNLGKPEEAKEIADNFIYGALEMLHFKDELNKFLNFYRSMRIRKKKEINGN